MLKSLMLPSLPETGKSEQYYMDGGHQAELRHDRESHEAFKVGLYVTRALDHSDTWEKKLRCFDRALKHHCIAPTNSSVAIIEFYGQMAHWVRERAGQEALQIASRQDDRYAARLAGGEDRLHLVQEGRSFFKVLLPTDRRPDWMNLEDFELLRMLKRQWA